ncbi:MAG: protein kinase [Myxococcota bacterium]|nr:protein kinase [Myxococcota bacterium]
MPAADPFAETARSDSEPSRAEAPDALLGRTLAHFRIDAPLGRGGMGAVYRGWDTALERPVAIKVLTAAHPDARARFLREARAQAKVRHPNVVPIHFVGEAEDVVFLSMDLVEGASVADRLASGPLDVEEALDCVDAVARALEEGQRRGLVHRDVKPSNVLRAEGGRVLLADFGLAKAVREQDEPASEGEAPSAALTHRGAIVGTPAYMAPEQTRPGPVDHRADMYALGVTLYEMVTGHRPFTAPDTGTLLVQHREETPLPARSLRPDLPPALDALISRLMEKAPGDRFETFDALRGAIAEARPRAPKSAGVFARGSAFAVDLMISGFVALLLAAVFTPIAWLIPALGWAAAESRLGLTVGKRLFDLRVVDPDLERPRFSRALVRNLVKHAGPIAMSVVDPFEAERWHPFAATALFVTWVLTLAVAAGREKRAVHDRVAKTRVVYDM